MRRSIIAALAFALLVPGVIRAADSPSLAPVLGAADWLNGKATSESIRGKVVLVDVFTVDCYNCRNVTPNLRALYKSKSNELAIIGVHTPETRWERDRPTVVGKLKELGVVWPVAIDNDSALWNAYGVDAWPTQLIFDRKGRLRKTIVGDSQDEVVDRTINELIAERS